MNQIHVLENHFQGKSTIVIGECCVNGCQAFHKSEAQEVFNAFRVSPAQQQEVMELFDQYNPNEEINFYGLTKALSTGHVMAVYKFVRLLIIHHKSVNLIATALNSQYDKIVGAAIPEAGEAHLDVHVHHSSNLVKAEIAKLGIKKYNDILKNDINDYVRACAIAFSPHIIKEPDNEFVYDPDYDLN